MGVEGDERVDASVGGVVGGYLLVAVECCTRTKRGEGGWWGVCVMFLEDGYGGIVAIECQPIIHYACSSAQSHQDVSIANVSKGLLWQRCHSLCVETYASPACCLHLDTSIQ